MSRLGRKLISSVITLHIYTQRNISPLEKVSYCFIYIYVTCYLRLVEDTVKGTYFWAIIGGATARDNGLFILTSSFTFEETYCWLHRSVRIERSSCRRSRSRCERWLGLWSCLRSELWKFPLTAKSRFLSSKYRQCEYRSTAAHVLPSQTVLARIRRTSHFWVSFSFFEFIQLLHFIFN